MNALKLKEANVTNVNNVIVQIPKLVVDLWKLQNGDSLSVTLSEDTSAIIIKKVTKETS